MAVAVRRASSASALAVGVARRLAGGAGASARARLATAGLYPVASLATAALAFGAADALHGSGFLAVYLAGLALGSANVPAKQTTTELPPGARLGRAAGDVPHARAARVPERSSATWRSRGRCSRSCSCSSRGRWPRPVRRCRSASRGAERVVLGWAGLRGAVPVVLATFPVIDGVPHSRRVLQHRVLRRAALDAAAGRDVRAARAAARGDDERARAAAAAGRGGHDPAARRRGARVPDRPGRRDRRRARARPRPAARRGGQRDRARRGGDPAARLHARCGPATGSTCSCARSRSREVRELTDRWRTGPIGPPPRAARAARGRQPVFSAWPLARPATGDAGAARTRSRPARSSTQLRIRRDEPGGLVVLDDGRYAITGPAVARSASARDLSGWARRRLRHADADERAWLQTVDRRAGCRSA